jgi:hypothetical protein
VVHSPEPVILQEEIVGVALLYHINAFFVVPTTSKGIRVVFHLPIKLKDF